jgi:hypothetical protein
MSSALYGGALGLGVVTATYYWSFLALVLAAAFTPSLLVGVGAGVAFGLGRSLLVILGVALPDERTLDHQANLFRSFLESREWLPRLVSAIATVGVALSFYLRAA